MNTCKFTSVYVFIDSFYLCRKLSDCNEPVAVCVKPRYSDDVAESTQRGSQSVVSTHTLMRVLAVLSLQCCSNEPAGKLHVSDRTLLEQKIL